MNPPEDSTMVFLRWFFWSLLFFGMVSCSIAVYAMDENGHTKKWCHPKGGETQYVLPDKTRIDCLLIDFAVESEWARNWKDGIGQATHYAHMTGQDPAILLIIEKPTDVKYINQLNAVVEKLCFRSSDCNCKRIKIFTMEKLP